MAPLAGFDPQAPFATVDDLEAAWRPLAEAERARAAKLLEYAERRIRAMLPEGWDERPGIAANLEPVTVESVRRQMAAGSVPVTQMSQGAGSYTASLQLANPAGDWYLKADEKELLGIGCCSISFASMEGGLDGCVA